MGDETLASWGDLMSLNWLLVFLPIGIGLNWFGASPILVFLTSALAIVPLAGLMGDATEALARFLGPTVGGLLNATLGNAPEIIISGLRPARGPGQHGEVFADRLDHRQPAVWPGDRVLRRRDQVSPESAV